MYFDLKKQYFLGYFQNQIKNTANLTQPSIEIPDLTSPNPKIENLKMLFLVEL